jgi:hypothetical protein
MRPSWEEFHNTSSPTISAAGSPRSGGRRPVGAAHGRPRHRPGATGYAGAVCIESFTAQNETIATTASIWCLLARSRDALARDGLSFRRAVTRVIDNCHLTKRRLTS